MQFHTAPLLQQQCHRTAALAQTTHSTVVPPHLTNLPCATTSPYINLSNEQGVRGIISIPSSYPDDKSIFSQGIGWIICLM